MPREYKPDPRGKQYKKHTAEAINRALADHRRGMSFRACSKKHGIPIAVLCRRAQNPRMKSQGGQTALKKDIEEFMAQRIATCASWGFPLDNNDVRYLVKGYLDKRGLTFSRFTNNTLSKDWVNSFVKRNENIISHRICQNIKPSRASLSSSTIKEFIANLAETLDGVPPSNIMNYDETNLQDDPGRKKVISKRGIKYPERVMDFSKSSISVMFAGCADGTLLPPYVCYKATHLYDAWTVGGPPGTRYNRSASGWFEMPTFEDWFETIALPYFSKLEGKKVLIGDNLSSHLSVEVVGKCELNQILFVFLPPNSTHILQPLDVSFFRPIKKAWRKFLEDKKRSCRGKPCSLAKDSFPLLLKSLYKEVYTNAASNIKAGFEKCGLFPLNVKPLAMLPHDSTAPVPVHDELAVDSTSAMDSSLVSILKEMRYGDTSSAKPKVQRKKKLQVEPGKSVGLADFPSTSGEACFEENDPIENNSPGDEEDSNFSIGNFVKFIYEGEFFPGQIVSVEEDGCVIKSMTRSGFNWRWPQHEDVMQYPFSDIKQKIAPPVPRKRGAFSVPELDEIWGHS